MSTCRFLAHNEADTQRLGAVLAETLPPGTTVGLIGTLGAGKTRLVQGLAAACGVAPDTVTSPTFVLCQPYRGRRLLQHWDAYRIKDDDEFLQLGPEESFASDAITLIEWSDRVQACLPPERIDIRITVAGATARTFDIAAVGERFAAVVAGIERRLAARREVAEAV